MHIVGGGVIGLCCAHYLEEAGWKVTVLDRSDMTDGTSYGNAGMIVPSHFIPLAAPGVIWKGIKWMLDDKSPFTISKKIDLSLLAWVYKFWQSSSQKKVLAAAPILRDYNIMSREAYHELGQLFNFASGQVGLLMLYQDPKVAAEERETALMAQNLGIEANILSAAELDVLDPTIKISAAGGVHYPGDAHLDPRLFMEGLRESLQRRGVKIETGIEVTALRSEANRISTLLCRGGKRISVDHMVVTAGIQSSELVRSLGIRLPMQPGKGYSFTLPSQIIKPSIPSILCDAKVAMTPMGANLRIGGTMEIGNASDRIDLKRVEGIMESVSKYYPQINPSGFSQSDIWYGLRPCSPDGLPYVGALKSVDNAWIASGHAMMGMSLGPATGKIICELLCGRKPDLQLDLFEPHRF